MKYQEIVNNKEINAYLKKGDANLGTMGFTDHSKAHCIQVSTELEKYWKNWDIPNMMWNLPKLQDICTTLEMPSTELITQNTVPCLQTIF